MIKDVGGRLHSVRTAEENAELLRREFEQLNDEERKVLLLLLEEMNDPAFETSSVDDEDEETGAPLRIFDVLKDAEFAREPVDIEQFVMDPYYLGQTCDVLYPKLLGDMKELFAGGYHEIILSGSIGYGKTFFASIAVCRCIYEISCLRDPYRSFGLAPKSGIAFVALSISETLAIKVVFENLATKLGASPYFKEHFKFEETKREMRFPNKIWVAARSSTDTSALGLNVIGAILDESNFMPPRKTKGMDPRFAGKSRAETLYANLKRRMKSRFQRHGKLPGMMIVVSSKKTKDDFTAQRVRESQGDAEVFVRDYALWEVKRDSYSRETFTVLVGNENVQSKLLDEEEIEPTREIIQSAIDRGDPTGLVIVEPPIDFKEDFERDLEGAIRDVAGVETVSIYPFLQQREHLISCVDEGREHPFDVIEWDQSKPGGFRWPLIAHQVEVRDGAHTFEAWQPLYYPGLTRHTHIDPSLNSDSTGVCVGCIVDYTTVERKDLHSGAVYTEQAPVIWIDLLMRIVPPVGGEINYGGIRSIIYQMQDKGFAFGLATMDQYNSADTLQKFKVKGIESERLSVDRPMDPYDTLKAALYERRVRYYKYNPLLEELRELQRDLVKNKVDHPPKGKKDIADALCGVVYSLTTNYHGGPLSILKGISSYPRGEMEEQRVMVEDEFFMPFITG
jgi:hypothetical protein